MKNSRTLKMFLSAGLFLYSTFLVLPGATLLAQSRNPVLFEPGIINTGEYESHPALTPNGKTLYFLKCTPDINNFCAICVSNLVDGKWTEPQVAPFSGQYYDIDPFVSSDGMWLYFASNRPVKRDGSVRTDSDIWRVSISSGGMGEPKHIEGDVNSDFDEYYPTLSDHGNLYFGSTRAGNGGSDIFKCEGVNGIFGKPENLGDSVNTINNEYEPFIAPDESYLIFMATIPGGLNNADFYLSYMKEGKWSKAIRLPDPINSAYTDWSPKITRDKKYLYFSSTRSIIDSATKSRTTNELNRKLNKPGNGLGDIYFVDATFLNDLNKRVFGKP